MRGDVAEASGLAGYTSSGGDYTPTVTVRVAEEDLDWHDLAACRPEMRPADMTAAEWTDIFFPERGSRFAPAKQICLDCPVRDDCLTAALDRGEKHGIWGGVLRT